MTRGFTLLSEDAKLPTRATKHAAGYDFYVPNKYVLTYTINPGETVKIPTDVAAYMQPDEVLMLYVRSSVGIKYNCVLANGTGIIDSDYYNNSDNKGNIIIALRNEGKEPITFKAGDRIAQGVFVKYLTTDNEVTVTTEREGGIGSTNK